MSVRALLVAFVLLGNPAWAEEPPHPDDLSRAYEAALADLISGKDRQGIVDRLKPVVDKSPTSSYARLARPFLNDLAASAKNPLPSKTEPPEKRLAESRTPWYLLKHPYNWDKGLQSYLKRTPDDPCSDLVAADRGVITRLIPCLADRTPTRGGDSSSRDWSTPHPRVCDLALLLIEYHSKCRFHTDTLNYRFLHQLPEAEHKKVAERVAAWWGEMKDKSIVAGLRTQLSQEVSYHEKIWMAKTLAQLAEGQKTDDRDFALNFLRQMVKDNPRTYVGTNAADALAEFGDMSAVDVFYDEWKSLIGQPGQNFQPHVTFYLCKHGRRREWELMHEISLTEIHDGKGPGYGAVWAHTLTSGVAGKNPYAIPFLGLALDQTDETGSRYVEKVGSQSFSRADTACEILQKQVNQDFGYRRNGTPVERLAAIKAARAWWSAEGKAKYTFDYIEKNLVAGKATPR